jgi:endonuclease/exonuclease/phosphatase family metal-dependent hydrolase
MRTLAALLLLLPAACAAPSQAGEVPPLRVMTYNVRYGTAKDGENHWDQRKELCVSRALAFDPDVLGLQEALDFQNAYFMEKLRGYAQLGVAREDGKEKGEYTTLIYRKARLELVESGTFWLSETPDAPGSKSWDSSLPRIATWAVFRDLKAGNRELLALNTHFDHRGPQARLESGRLIRKFLTSKSNGRPVLVTGDFNAGPGSAPHQALVNPIEGSLPLVDVFAATLGGKPEPGIATGHGWQGERPGVRIDWILATPHFAPLDAAIDLHREGARWPSDHFPVTARVSWR